MSVIKIEYCSESEDSTEFDENVKKKIKKIRVQKQWRKDREFQCAEEAENYILSIDEIKKVTKYSGIEGERVNFRCCNGQYRKNECPVEYYLLYHADSFKVSLFKTNEEHANHMPGNRGINKCVKKSITQMYNDGIRKPNAIIAALRSRDMEEPTKIQLNNFLSSLRTKQYGRSNISAGELREWCNKKSVIPENEDEVFVLDYHITCEEESQDLDIVLSTKRLLQLTGKCDLVQADATYKLNWQGYPVLIVGSSDQQRAFHPYAIAVCSGEKATNFHFIFQAIQKTCMDLFQSTWKPRILLAAASNAITKGFELTFGTPYRRLTCYLHMIKNIECKLKRLGSFKTLLLQDIEALHISSNDESFTVACQLFKKKWQDKNNEEINKFIEYFETVWMGANHYWYEGACVNYPSTNNGLESINAQIKNEHTFRERLPVGQFMDVVVNSILKKWTLNRDPQTPNFREFKKKPLITLKQWTDTYHWLKLNPEIYKETTNDSNSLFYVSSSIKDPLIQLNPDFIQDYKNKYLNWTSFDEFTEHTLSIWKIKYTSKENEDSVMHCTCPKFSKEYVCKHSLGILVFLGKEKIPNDAKNISLGQKRKRGRPALAKRALLIQ